MTEHLSLDDFRSCEVAGCFIQVLEPEIRCTTHGGHPEAAYLELADGEMLPVTGFPPVAECE